MFTLRPQVAKCKVANGRQKKGESRRSASDPKTDSLFATRPEVGAYLVAHETTARLLKSSLLKTSKGAETANDARTVAMLKVVAIDFMVGRNV